MIIAQNYMPLKHNMERLLTEVVVNTQRFLSCPLWGAIDIAPSKNTIHTEIDASFSHYWR
jgi:hypothetical protein